MRKILALILGVTLSFGLVACDTIEPIDTLTEPTETVIPTEPTLVTEPTIPTEPIITEPIEEEPIEISSFDRLFDDTKVKKITIEISTDEWENLDDVMLDYYSQFGNYRTDYYAKAKMIYEDGEGSITVDEIGFRTRGNTSRVRIVDDQGNPQLSHFKLSFHEDFDLLENEIYKDRTVFDVEELDLKYNRNWDSTYISEKYSYDLFNAMGVFAPHTTLTRFFVKIGNQTYDYGIYTVVEPIDKLFLKKRVGGDQNDGNLYKALWQQYGPAALQTITQDAAIGIKDESINYRPAYDLKTNKKTNDTSDLVKFINQINGLNGSSFQTYIEENFEVDMMLRLLAVGVVLGNPDDYRAMGNNYFLYHNNVTNKWVMIPYDYDHSLGQGWSGEPVFSDYTVNADIYTWGNLNAYLTGIEGYAHPLTDKLLSIEAYQLQYESYLSMLIDEENGLFGFDAFYQAYDQQKQLFKPYATTGLFKLDFNRRNTEWYFDSKVQSITNQLQYYELHPEERP